MRPRGAKVEARGRSRGKAKVEAKSRSRGKAKVKAQKCKESKTVEAILWLSFW